MVGRVIIVGIAIFAGLILLVSNSGTEGGLIEEANELAPRSAGRLLKYGLALVAVLVGGWISFTRSKEKKDG